MHSKYVIRYFHIDVKSAMIMYGDSYEKVYIKKKPTSRIPFRDLLSVRKGVVSMPVLEKSLSPEQK